MQSDTAVKDWRGETCLEMSHSDSPYIIKLMWLDVSFPRLLLHSGSNSLHVSDGLGKHRGTETWVRKENGMRHVCSYVRFYISGGHICACRWPEGRHWKQRPLLFNLSQRVTGFVQQVLLHDKEPQMCYSESRSAVRDSSSESIHLRRTL